ncbi:MAG: tyrosine-type recombinase/integrase [Magnetococcus sp. WYHC-3]
MAAKICKRQGRDTWFVYLDRGGKRYYRSHYDDRTPMLHERMARRIAEAINADIEEKGKHFDPRQWFRTGDFEFQFSVYAEKWISKKLMGYAPDTRRNNQRYTQWAIDFFKEMDIRQIRKAHVEDYLATLPLRGKRPLSAKTCKNALDLLHVLFNDAYQNELLLRVPGWPKIQVPEPEIKWIDAEWQDRIIAEIPERDRPIFIFIRTYGCRPGEARALQWDCVDFEKEVITIRRTFSGCGTNHLEDYTKTKRNRFLPFSDEIREIFRRTRGIGGFVFRNKSGRPYTSDISRIWNEAQNTVKAPRITLYQGTRHSFGTQRASEGHSLKIIGDILGHTRPQMTQRYAAANLEGMKRLLPNRCQGRDK